MKIYTVIRNTSDEITPYTFSSLDKAKEAALELLSKQDLNEAYLEEGQILISEWNEYGGEWVTLDDDMSEGIRLHVIELDSIED